MNKMLFCKKTTYTDVGEHVEMPAEYDHRLFMQRFRFTKYKSLITLFTYRHFTAI